MAASGRPTELADGRRSWAGFLLWMLLAAAAAALAVDGSSLRARGVALLERAGLASAQAVVDTALVMPAAGDAAAFAAESVLARLGPDAPAPAPADRADLIAGARSLALEALADSPGGPQQRVLVGRSAYAAWELQSNAQPDASRGWERALTIASSGAPGFEAASAALASAYLGAWPRLSEPERRRALPALTAAFRSPSFVRRELPAALSRLGPEPTLRLFPRERAALEAASAVLAALNQPGLAEQAARAAAEAPASPSSPTSIP
jgi:hypothetical protein